MKPSCNRCGDDIRWEGFDLTKDEYLCGLCIVTMRIGAERERERIIALIKLSEVGGYPDADYIVALIKGEN